MKKLLPDNAVRARYGVSASTIYRWDRNPDLGFPKPVTINGRLYRSEAELDTFDAARIAERETVSEPNAA